MPICGPKTAACCTVLSTWGLVQLGITGVFMYLGSPALVEDIPLEENRCKISRMYSALHLIYFSFSFLMMQTLSCRIAAMQGKSPL